MTHGTRASYLTGCHCFSCRVANTAYIHHYRHSHRAGRVLLGARISSQTALQLLQQLHREHVSKTAIATALGLRSPGLKVHNQITVRRHLKIQRLHRRYMSESAEPEDLGL